LSRLDLLDARKWTVETERGEADFILRTEDATPPDGAPAPIASNHGIQFIIPDRWRWTGVEEATGTLPVAS
jgi:hypothetical protein